MPTKIELCNASDLDVGAVLKVEKNDLTLAVFNLDGEFCVTDDACTHGPGSLSEGFVDGHAGPPNALSGRVYDANVLTKVLQRILVDRSSVADAVSWGQLQVEALRG